MRTERPFLAAICLGDRDAKRRRGVQNLSEGVQSPHGRGRVLGRGDTGDSSVFHALMPIREEALAELAQVDRMIAGEYREKGLSMPVDTTAAGGVGSPIHA